MGIADMGEKSHAGCTGLKINCGARDAKVLGFKRAGKRNNASKKWEGTQRGVVGLLGLIVVIDRKLY